MTFPRRWDYTLRLGDVFHNDRIAFVKKRDEIAKRIRALPLEGSSRGDAECLSVEIEWTTEPDEFDEVWNRFYDFADRERIWVETWPSPKGTDA